MCIAQGRLNSAVPPCLTRRMSGPPRPLCAPYREAHGFPTGASPPLAARPLRLLLGSERLALATAGRLTAHDLPSLAGDAAGKTLSVNALAKMIAQGRQQTRSIQRLYVSFSRSTHNGHRVPHCKSQSEHTGLGYPKMNKSDACLHKKSPASGGDAFPAAAPAQNGGKIEQA